MEWDLLRVGVSWGSKHSCCLGNGDKGHFQTGAPKIQARKAEIPNCRQPMQANCSSQVSSCLQFGQQVVARIYWLIQSLYSQTPPTQLPADSETEISSMEATIWPLLHHCTWKSLIDGKSNKSFLDERKTLPWYLFIKLFSIFGCCVRRH